MRTLFQEPAAREARPDWSAVPAGIVDQLQRLLQENIVCADTAWGGYSPAAAFVITLNSARKVFLKGTHPGDDTHGTRTLEQEIKAYHAIPGIRHVSPAYLGSVSDGGEDGWRLAAFEHIKTAPTLPWTPEKIGAVFDLLRPLHFCRDIPSGIPDAADKNYIEKFLRAEGGWLRLYDDKAVANKFISLFGDEEAGRAWLSASLPILCRWQRQAPNLNGPPGILHQDLRSDNVLFDSGGRAYLIDWPNFCRGPIVLDIAGFISTVSEEGPLQAGTLLELYEKKSATRMDKNSLAVALASLSGHMADNAYRAVPQKLPRLRWMQKKTLWGMLQWAVTLLDMAPPPRFR